MKRKQEIKKRWGQLNTCCSAEFEQQIKDFCAERDITVSKFVKTAIVNEFRRWKEKERDG